MRLDSSGTMMISLLDSSMLTLFRNSKKIKNKDLKKYFQSANCLEISNETKIVFVGGSGSRMNTDGRPVVIAIRFDESLETLVVHATISKGIKDILVIKIIDSQQDKIGEDTNLIIAGISSIMLAQFSQKTTKMQELRVWDNLHFGGISDFVFVGNTIYTAAEKDDYLCAL